MRNVSPGVVRFLSAGVLFTLVSVAYSPALHNGFVWDDNSYVTNNPTLQTRDGLKSIWLKPRALPQYYPLVFTTFWVEYQLWGEHPAGYHATNIMLHALNAIVLWLVLQKLRVSGAWMIAAVFALHPVHVESVAWISERKNVLSGLCYLLACWSYLHARFPDKSLAVSDPSTSQLSVRTSFALLWQGLTVLSYLCALLSKTVTASLPVILGLVLWWKHQRLQRKDLVQLSGLLVVGAAFGLLTVMLEKSHVGAQGEMWAFSFIDRCLIAGRALWFYMGKLLWPSPIMFSYPRWIIDSSVWWQYVYLLAAIAVAILCWWARKHLGKAPFVAVAYFGITLFPALGFFNVYPMRFSFVADHFQYLASIGMLALGIGAVTVVVHRARVQNRYVVGIGVTVLLILASRIRIECEKYENVETLWRDTVAKNPDSLLAHYNLAGVLTPQGELEEAVEHYYEAIRLQPNFFQAHYNLAGVLTMQGKFEEAIDHYHEVIRLQPDYKFVYANLGLTLARQGKFEDAIPYYRQELEINPEYAADVHNNLGNALLELGRVEDAILHYRAALEIDPSHAESHNSLGLALAMTGDIQNAFHHYFEALRSKPGYENAETNLVQALATPESVQECVLLLQRYDDQRETERLQFALSVIQKLQPDIVPLFLERVTL